MDVYQEKKFDDNKDWFENFEKLRKFCKKLYFSKMQRKIFNKKLLKESVIKVPVHFSLSLLLFFYFWRDKNLFIRNFLKKEKEHRKLYKNYLNKEDSFSLFIRRTSGGLTRLKKLGCF